MADKFQQAYALLSKYMKLYKGRYGHTPVVNKYREKWGMQDVVDSVGGDRALQLLEYYFKLSRSGHPLVWFYQNFDRLDQQEKAKRADAEKIARLHAETTARVRAEEQLTE